MIMEFLDKFLKFVDPVVDFFETGKICRKPVQWIYYLIAVLCVIFPIYLFAGMVETWKYIGGGYIFVEILVWIVVAALFVWLALFWYKHAGMIPGTDNKFVAVPVVVDFLKTFGETIGIIIAVVGVLVGILSLFIGGNILSMMGVPGFGVAMIVIAPIVGFITIIITRYMAELTVALVDIANNTDKIAKK